MILCSLKTLNLSLPRTWAFPSDVHHLDVGAHLQQRFQELVGLAVEGAGEHLGTASVSGGKFGHMQRRQSGELSAHLLRLSGEKDDNCCSNRLNVSKTRLLKQIV